MPRIAAATLPVPCRTVNHTGPVCPSQGESSDQETPDQRASTRLGISNTTDQSELEDAMQRMGEGLLRASRDCSVDQLSISPPIDARKSQEWGGGGTAPFS